jgi:hypothetical protein
MTRPGVPRVRPAAGVVAALVIVVIGGCTLLPASFGGLGGRPSPRDPVATGRMTRVELGAREAAWRGSGIESYDWFVAYLCECGVSNPVAIVVQQGRVISEQDGNGEFGTLTGFPLTVDDLFTRARATLDGGGTVSAGWDARGVPTSITFDPEPLAIDDELTVRVNELTVTGQPGPS